MPLKLQDEKIIVICIAFLIMSCSEEKEIVVDTTDPYLWLEEVRVMTHLHGSEVKMK